MSVEIVFETHSLSEDNERGRATGWLDGRLSVLGRRLAEELSERRRADNPAAVFSSDLGRARETTTIAFGTAGLPILWDWRLRECDWRYSVPAALEDASRSSSAPLRSRRQSSV